MKIGIDCRLWAEAGNGRYLRNLVFNLAKLDSKNDYYLFLLKKDLGQKMPKNFHQVEANFRWYTFSEQTLFLKILNKYNLDLVHFPHFNVPILYRGKFVVTIHDMTHQKFKMKRASTRNSLVYNLKHQAYNLAFYIAVKKSQRIITPAEFVKKELIEGWKVSPSKIVVTYEAAEEKFIADSKNIKESQIKKTLDKFNIKPPFIFYIGNAHPHKNVEGLIKAFQNLRKSYQYLTLVLSGKSSYFWERIKKEYKEKDIIYTDFITDEEYIALLKSASCYIQPSFEEGFGIPLLEAMAVGCPVVSSNSSSLPEVGADAALYFDPRDINDMTDKIKKVLNDQKLKRELIEKGQRRYREFSWKKMAEQTLKVYQEVL